MKRHALLMMLVIPIIVTLTVGYSDSCYADKYYLQHGDFVDFGFNLYANEILQGVKSEADPVKINFAPDIISPPGLFDVMDGMKNGAILDRVVITPADGGYESSDPEFGHLAGEVVEFRNLQIYAINNFLATDVFPPGGDSDFGRILLIVLGVVLGLGVVIGGSYFIYRYSPKIFGKRCLTCKSLAVGRCTNCGKAFCEKCFSNGCPSCKGRSLIRTK